MILASTRITTGVVLERMIMSQELTPLKNGTERIGNRLITEQYSVGSNMSDNMQLKTGD